VPAAPAAPLTQPRALYLESVAGLEAAKTEAQTRQALKLLQQAAALGHPPAQLQLGELYKLGQGVDQDAAQARLWYERAAEGGNVLAMHRAGVMAARGQGGPADQAAAIAWFERAANLGLVDSQYNLGATYHPANDGAPNPAQNAGEACYWYSLAARNGDEQAKTLAAGLAANLSPGERRAIDERVAEWKAETPDANANEVASAH
jgi:localization factor PodJL